MPIETHKRWPDGNRQRKRLHQSKATNEPEKSQPLGTLQLKQVFLLVTFSNKLRHALPRPLLNSQHLSRSQYYQKRNVLAGNLSIKLLELGTLFFLTGSDGNLSWPFKKNRLGRPWAEWSGQQPCRFPPTPARKPAPAAALFAPSLPQPALAPGFSSCACHFSPLVPWVPPHMYQHEHFDPIRHWSPVCALDFQAFLEGRIFFFLQVALFTMPTLKVTELKLSGQ